MNIVIFADVHGRILLCFKLVERFKRETGKKIDLILQCGDLGIYPDLSRLDKATKRYAENDETELGFYNDFTKETEVVKEILSKVSCDLVCVRGNHDDHLYLDEVENSSQHNPYSIDYYTRIKVLKSGIPFKFIHNKNIINILGIGRIGPPENETEKIHTII